MEFNSDEKLMLFLIRWCMELDLDISKLEKDNTFSDDVILGWINENNKFQKLLSEANEAKEEFEFWVSDENLKAMKNKEWFIAWGKKTDNCRHKIKITIGD